MAHKIHIKHSRLVYILIVLLAPITVISQNSANGYVKSSEPINYSLTPKLPDPPKAEPFKVTTIPIPQKVLEVALVNYLPDGEHLIMDVTMRGKRESDLAVMKEDGSDFKCLTCNLNQPIGDEMPVPLPDGKRVYTPKGILECSPSIVNCKEAKILPLVYPQIPGTKILARIATNMSQDGKHVAYTLVTTRPIPLVLISELTRVSDVKGDRYELTNTKVIAGEKIFETDSSYFRPFFYGCGEVKSFTGMGRCLQTITTFEANNYDISKIDLKTGELSRFTRHYSYDEGVYPSPDGKWIIFQSQRQTNRMDAFGLIPRPLIAGTAIGSGMAEYRNQWVAPNREGNDGKGKVRRFYGLTMTDQYGDRVRLPEDGYTGQNLTVAKDNLTEYNAFGNFTWHKTSTKGIFWEQKDHWKLKEGEQVGRLRLIRFTSRKPTKPLSIYTPTLDWTTKLENIKPLVIKIPTEGTLMGKVSGYARISIDSSAIQEPMFKIEYFNFTDDGEYVLNGYEKKTNKLFSRESHWFADIKVSGKHKGFLKADNVRFHADRIGSGTIKAELDKHIVDVDLAKGLPTGVPGELR
jgi:hypothetical protein